MYISKLLSTLCTRMWNICNWIFRPEPVEHTKNIHIPIQVNRPKVESKQEKDFFVTAEDAGLLILYLQDKEACEAEGCDNDAFACLEDMCLCHPHAQKMLSGFVGDKPIITRQQNQQNRDITSEEMQESINIVASADFGTWKKD